MHVRGLETLPLPKTRGVSAPMDERPFFPPAAKVRACGSSTASTPTPRASRAGSWSAACSTCRARRCSRRCSWLEAEGDELRRLLLFEPRGSAPLSLDLVLPSAHPEADAGFLIMESCSYEGMSGSNTINTATVILETGIVPMTEPVTSLVLEAPAGLVRVTADCRDGRCERVTFENVPSFALGARRAGGGPGARRDPGRPRLRRRVLRVRRRRGARLRDRPGGGARAGRPRRADPARRSTSSWRSRTPWSRR